MHATRVIGFFFVILVSPLAFSWGQEGHRITGYVAEDMLTAKARLQLKQIIPGADLGEIALYMDQQKVALKSKLPGSDKWHYDNQPACESEAYADYCKNGDCASTKISQYYRVLIDDHSTQDEKAQAIRFLVHMIGDLHQPLHMADDHDAGGNGKWVTLPGRNADRKLHQVWDSDFVKLAYRGSDEKTFANSLVAEFQSQKAGWQKGQIRVWTAESYKLSTDVAYGKLPGFTCSTDRPDESIQLDDSYVAEGVGIVKVQLAKAGARIAYVLNRALGR